MAFKVGVLINKAGLAMSTGKLLIILIGGLFASWAKAQDLPPMLGQPLERTPQATIGPDGASLPPGSGSVGEGEVIYRNQCAACHGPGGLMPGNALAGGIGSLSSAAPNRTVGSYWPYATSLFDYIHRAMPYGREKTLTNSEVYSVTAYVLFLNGIVAHDIRIDANSLAKIAMPNRQGFQSVYQPSDRN